jgi:hypothetical protein
MPHKYNGLRVVRNSMSEIRDTSLEILKKCSLSLEIY